MKGAVVVFLFAVLVVAALWASMHSRDTFAAAPPAPMSATLYEDCNYSTGSKFSQLGAGTYATPAEMKLNGGSLSSLKIPSGLMVTLYEFENFQGRSTVLTSDTVCLLNNPMSGGGNWNDKTYSVKIDTN
jgi:hypothetical protein